MALLCLRIVVNMYVDSWNWRCPSEFSIRNESSWLTIGRTHTHTHKRTQATKILGGPNWNRVKSIRNHCVRTLMYQHLYVLGIIMGINVHHQGQKVEILTPRYLSNGVSSQKKDQISVAGRCQFCAFPAAFDTVKFRLKAERRHVI